MALFAHAVASPPGKLRWINDCAWIRMQAVIFARTMAAFAGNSSQFGRVVALFDASRVTDQAIGSNRTREIEKVLGLIPGRNIPFRPRGVIGGGRLKKMSPELD